MEMIFLLTGWEFARDGKKATDFARICHALGVEFDLSLARDRILSIGNRSTKAGVDRAHRSNASQRLHVEA